MSGKITAPRMRYSGLFVSMMLAYGSTFALEAQAAESVSHIELKVQPLSQALNDLARQAGVNIIVSGNLADGRQAPAISADLTAVQALKLLLKGTELEAQPLGSGNFVIVQAAPIQASAPVLSRVVVTGSNISSRAGTEGPNAVQVIDAEAIGKSGKQTVGEVLRTISAFNGRSDNENTSSNWGAGSSAVGLHGLSSKNTLVLLNGRRLASYGFPNMLSDMSPDINSLPSAAIERIEILKDGASAVYGSDAVAGVINLITRQNYQGLEGKMSNGYASQGGAAEKKVILFGGLGDLDHDGYNLFFSFDAYQRDRLDQNQRDLTKSGDYSSKPGGSLNGWSAQGARYLDSAGVSHPLLDEQGNCPTGTVLRASQPIDGKAGNTCAYNLTSNFASMAGSERYQFFSSGNFKMAGDTELFYEGLYSHVHGNTLFYNPYFTLDSGRLAYNPATGLPQTVSNTLLASSPNNLTGQNLNLEYGLQNLGVQVRETSSDLWREVLGWRGNWRGWDWEGSLLQSQNKVDQNSRGGQANQYTLLPALQDGSYNLLHPELTSQAVIDSIRLSTRKSGQSDMRGAGFKVSNSLFELPAGPVDFAGGVEWREESINVTVPSEITSGESIRPHLQSVDGKRHVSAVYGELNVPLTDTLEAQLAAREDVYSDFGNAFSPKVSLRYQPLKQLLFRTSASRGFRAPSLAENGSANYVLGNDTVYDPAQGRRVAVAQISTGGDNLSAERTRNFSAGMVVSPDELTNISLDYYKIYIDDAIGYENADDIVARNDPTKVIRDANGYVNTIYRSQLNLSQIITSGLELGLDRLFPTSGYGTFELKSDATYIRDYRVQLTTNGPLVDLAGTNLQSRALPKLKAVTSLGWKYGKWDTQLTWNYTGGYQQKMLATGNGIDSRVKAYNQFDAYIGYHGFNNLTLFGSVENIENKTPPYDPAGYTAFAYSVRAPYDVGQYNLLGRYMRVGLEYKFF